jgi:hypothetical protein
MQVVMAMVKLIVMVIINAIMMQMVVMVVW